MRSTHLTILLLAAACGGSSTEAPPPPLTASISQVNPGAIKDTATFKLTTTGATGTANFIVKMDGSSTVYTGTANTFLLDTRAVPSAPHELAVTATDSKNRTASASIGITVSHAVPVRFASMATNSVIGLQCGNSTWVPIRDRLTLGLSVASTDSLNQTCQMLGDSSYAGIFYSVSSAVYALKTETIVTVSASIAFSGSCWNPAETTIYLQRNAVDSTVISRSATITWNSLINNFGGSAQMPNMGTNPPSAGYLIRPVIVFKLKCSSTSDSKVTVSDLKITYNDMATGAKKATFSADSVTLTSTASR
ncbi:hypothetical protein KW785_00820 [Candidatus Parcubacteria bacterium]|nr:hypothetical protein [Candidatus Parcubacteria bacterium]